MAIRKRPVTRAGLGTCYGCGQLFKVADHDSCPHCGTDKASAPARVGESAGIRGGVLAASLLGLSISAMACGSDDKTEPGPDAGTDAIESDAFEEADEFVSLDAAYGGPPEDIVEDVTTEDAPPTQDVYGAPGDVFEDVVPTDAAYGGPPDVVEDIDAEEDIIPAPEYGLPADAE